jgi:hypothetical protein
MRVATFIGLIVLGLVGCLGLGVAIVNGDWRGTLVCSGLLVLVFGAFKIVRDLGRSDQQIGSGISAPKLTGWAEKSLVDFFRGPVLRTIEGKVFLMGSVVAFILLLIVFLAPGWLPKMTRTPHTAMAVLAWWPLLLFMLFVKQGFPTFQSSLWSISVMIVAAGYPFYLLFY